MESMIGLINLDQERDFLNELTYFRCGAAVPFGGRYRLIDFTLSSMVDAGISEVAIFAPSKYRSLMDHLGSGENWGLARRNGRLFILPPDWHDPTDLSAGDLRYFHNNRDFFARSASAHVLISGSQFLSNDSYQAAFAQHLELDADVTLLSTEMDPTDDHRGCSRLEVDENHNVTALTYEPENRLLFTGAYIIKKRKLLALVDECIARHKQNLFHEGVKGNLHSLRVKHHVQNGYAVFITSIKSYYRQHMNLLNCKNFKELFYQAPRIRTKISNEPPTQYLGQASAQTALVANGCVIEGSVEKSVLFRGVHVHKGSRVKNSIVMQRCIIEEGVYLENVILDKDVTIASGQTLIGSSDKPYVIAKRQTVS
ncbi:glucose-1-phosphate adenylyltransferase subunit GlgD [Shouchella shacheensis]|uniref:glucose-1-phosphate adenylyltransferase subunit GlgD n=1 Tax=Shouchella shacheensis TaxID=1649580 RepID=UPI00073FC0EC|nr:glucose-1-phosphate adenylyltransferase subunit GlgD [Shouchella shacheensis]